MERISSSKLPLTSLTKEACQTLFALAFGYAPPLERLYTFSNGALTIRFDDRSIFLDPTGLVLVMDQEDRALSFNARKLITQLDAYNVVFGDDFISKLLN
ncbi:hypothetical protein GO755_33635 [Spirosoma sp. HMF4905]|uniref:Uncharacterized protein n=1 Tax=Spirosoma arboris TaxID=2682092 RepID=A0A7K1SMK8_9BACT|nr:hypothetical protein [Spirosoma arboris]MVM35018.1 hypothetical protein [Spirosoma arboris]